VTDSYEYDAFGNHWTVEGTTPNNMLYRGEEYDPDLSLVYLRARYMNPLTGRFMSRDPEDGTFQSPITLHKYIYADGDPIDLSDPTGRTGTGISITIGRTRVPIEYVMLLSLISIPVAEKSLPPITCAINALLSMGALGVKGYSDIAADFPDCSATGTAPTDNSPPTVYPLPFPFPITWSEPRGPYHSPNACDPGEDWHHIVRQGNGIRQWAEECGIPLDSPGFGMCLPNNCHLRINGNSNGTNWQVEWINQINNVWGGLNGECPSINEVISFAQSKLTEFAEDLTCQ